MGLSLVQNDNDLWLVSSILGVILILFLTFWGSRWIAKSMIGTSNGNSKIKIIDKIMLSQDKFLVVAKVAENVLLLGITGQSVTLIKELNPEDYPQSDTYKSTNQSFIEILNKAKIFKNKSESEKDDSNI